MSTSASDLKICQAMLRGGSRTFFAASLILPRRVREPATALYAFCRLADDAVDIEGGRLAMLTRLNDRLSRAYEGRPLPLAVDRAFADAVTRFAIPRSLPEALLEGLAWDAVGRRYETLSELRTYAVRVAGTVGAMMAVLMGARSPEAIARACDLGVAMQLTNIARDVGEDARADRLYLPLTWLRDAGIDPQAWLVRPTFSPALGATIQRLLQEADVLYRRSGAGLAYLPWTCRPGIRLARTLYADIGREVERRGGDSVSHRAKVSAGRKLSLLAQTLVEMALPNPRESAPALEEARFLVDAVAADLVPQPEPPAWLLSQKLIWLIDLFERLERRELFDQVRP
jgi:15-cis-phytoene synthase